MEGGRGVGRAELGGGGAGGCPSSLKFLPGVGLREGVKFLIYFWEEGGGGSGQPGNPSGYTLGWTHRYYCREGYNYRLQFIQNIKGLVKISVVDSELYTIVL